MKKCQNCGSLIQDKAVFCPKCGTKNQAVKFTENKIKKKNKKFKIIILCLIFIVAIIVVLVSKFMKTNDEENGVKNDRAVLYDNTIYFIKDRKLYKANADGTKQKEIKKLPHDQMGQDGDGYDNLIIYKDRLYAIRWTSYSLDEEYYIFSISLDGKDYKKEVTLPRFKDGEGPEQTGDIQGFSIVDDYIYFTYGLSDYEGENTYYAVYKQKLGTTKKIKTKYDSEEKPELSGKYAYYIENNDDTGTSKLIRMDLESGKEDIYYRGEKLNTGYRCMAVLKKQLVFLRETEVLWTDLKGKKNIEGREVTSNTENFIWILNANEEKIIYKVNDNIYKMNLKTKSSEKLISEGEIQNDTGAEIKKIELLGNNMAVYGYIDEEERDEFIIFIEEKEGMSYKDYESEIREKIEQCQ